MASSTALISVLLLSTILATAVAQSPAPAPSPAGPINVTAILEKAGNHMEFIRLLNHSHIDNTINQQLNGSYDGLTLFAPTDNAFHNLSFGTVNNLTDQQQNQLAFYHLLPKFYTFATFANATNPLKTMAAGNYTLNVTVTGGQVTISTGVVSTTISNAIRGEFPLAVYSLEKVLLPNTVLATKAPSPAAAPAPATVPAGPSHNGSPPGVESPLAPPPKGSSAGRVEVRNWVVGLGVMGVLGSLL